MHRARQLFLTLTLIPLAAFSGLLAAVQPAAAAEPVKIVLLPIVVHSSESQGYLQAGLADMLSSRLQQVSALDVIEIEDDGAATTRLERAVEHGRRAGGDFVLFGSFTRFGQGASLDMQCASTEGDSSQAPLREIFVHSGSIGDVIPDLDALVGKVSRFVIQGYRAEGDGEAIVAAGGGGSDGSLGELIRRIETLEEALGIGPGASVPIPLPEPGT